MKPPPFYNYQVEGIAKLEGILACNRGALLADSMGLGKTLQALQVATDLKLENVLILCPVTLRSVWRNESAKWFGHDVNVTDTSKPVVTDGWNCVAYSTIWRPSHVKVRRRNWDLIICDEAHLLKSYGQIAGTDSKVATCVYRDLLPKATKVILITGTPIKNRPSEFWPLAQFLLPGNPTMKNRFAFARKYCAAFQGSWGWDDTGSSNLKELRSKMDRVMVRRLKAKVLTELPAKVISVIELPKSREMKMALDFDSGEVVASMATVEKIRERMAKAKETNSIEAFQEAQSHLKEVGPQSINVLAKMRSTLSEPKAHAAAAYCKILLDGGVDAIVIGCWHKKAGTILADALAEYGVVKMDGSTPMKDREGMVAAFQAGEVKVFIGNIIAAGVGITLTRASHVVMAEVSYSPSDLSQFIDRCHRIGQKDSVQAHLLCIEQSVDSIVMASLAKKVEVIASAVDGRTEKHKRESGRIQACKPLHLIGEALDREDREFCHWHVYKLSDVSAKGSVADGLGFSGADAGEGKRLANLKRPSPQDYGAMALLVIRHRRQITNQPKRLARIHRLVVG